MKVLFLFQKEKKKNINVTTSTVLAVESSLLATVTKNKNNQLSWHEIKYFWVLFTLKIYIYHLYIVMYYPPILNQAK